MPDGQQGLFPDGHRRCARHGIILPCHTCAAEGIALREEAIDRVTENANEAWKLRGKAILHSIARRLRDVTSEDVWGVIDLEDVHTHERRAMTDVMRHGERAGWIEHYEPRRWVPSRRPSRHRAPVEVWRSRIYRAEEVVR